MDIEIIIAVFMILLSHTINKTSDDYLVYCRSNLDGSIKMFLQTLALLIAVLAGEFAKIISAVYLSIRALQLIGWI